MTWKQIIKMNEFSCSREKERMWPQWQIRIKIYLTNISSVSKLMQQHQWIGFRKSIDPTSIYVTTLNIFIVIPAYFGDGSRRLNLIGIDWTSLNSDYINTAARTRFVGRVIAEFLNSAIQQNLIRPKDLSLVGHSLSAHIAGFTGKWMRLAK